MPGVKDCDSAAYFVPLRMSITDPLEIVIVDDHPLMREALAAVFERHPRFKVYAAVNASDALALLEDFRPDIVLTDLDMQPIDGIALTRLLLQRFAGLTIIGFSATTAQHRIRSLLAAGAAGIIPKGTAIADLFQQVLDCHARNEAKKGRGK
jgi:DNA-binding NarL/FixJ family response regulator